MARRRPLTLALAIACLLGAAAPAHARVAVDAGPPPVPAADRVFPIDGKSRYGDFATYFGGGRGHQGQDVFADCGTPLVAAEAGRVTDAKFHGSAGNYVVIETERGRNHMYAHLRAPARVRPGDRVAAGERLGAVGDSGNAWDCHLHFEIWTAPGWYRGGHAVDPLPYLKQLG